MPTTNRGGCRVAPSCFSCPLPDCVRGDDRAVRDAELARLSREGWTAARLAVRYGITRRHVFRVLAAQREEFSL